MDYQDPAPDLDELKTNIKQAIGICTHRLEHLRAAIEAEWPRVVRIAKAGTDWSDEDKAALGDMVAYTYFSITRDSWKEDQETVAAIRD